MNQEQPTTERGRLQQRYNTARSNLLLVIILTLVNIVLLFTESESMLLFSASIPYYAVVFGVLLDILPMGLAVAAVLLVLYFLCWLLSKKRSGWLIVALVLFVLDTLGMVGLYLLAEDFSGVLDALIHIWVLAYLIMGISAAKKLKNLPEDVQIPVDGAESADYAQPEMPKRRIDENEKSRIFVEGNFGGHRIVFRRVKRTNQLVIDNYICDETEMVIETAHALSAVMDTHEVIAGYDGHHSYIKVDGQVIVKKIRWY